MKTVKVHGVNVVEFNARDTRYTLYKYIDKRISDAVHVKFSFDYLLDGRRLNVWKFNEDGTVVTYKFTEPSFGTLEWVKDCILSQIGYFDCGNPGRIKHWCQFHL